MTALFLTLDRGLRRTTEFFFGPMYEWRLTRWLIRRRGGNPDDYAALGPLDRPVFRRPIKTYDDALDEGEAWGAYYRGESPKPHIASELQAAAEPRWTRENRIQANRRLLETLADLWDAYPDMRFGQLVMNLSREPGGFADTWEWGHATWRERIEKSWAEWAEAHNV